MNSVIGFIFVNVVWLVVCVASFIAGVVLADKVKESLSILRSLIGKLFGSGGSI